MSSNALPFPLRRPNGRRVNCDRVFIFGSAPSTQQLKKIFRFSLPVRPYRQTSRALTSTRRIPQGTSGGLCSNARALKFVSPDFPYQTLRLHNNARRYCSHISPIDFLVSLGPSGTASLKAQ